MCTSSVSGGKVYPGEKTRKAVISAAEKQKLREALLSAAEGPWGLAAVRV